jgi:UDP-N-acetylmuramoyl-L-alanyl-D-glutamate--2,6-diaminopimelate ligase
MPTARDIANAVNGRLSGPAAETRDVTHNAQQCQTGSVFVAIRGTKADGHAFIDQALQNGARVVISELPPPADFPAAWIQVADARRALASAAAAVYGRPSRDLNLVGVTGTNGKTTTVYILDAIFRAAFGVSAMLGTVETRIGDDSRPARLTTPEASETQAFLRRAVDAGCRYAAMEVSSVALDLHRVGDVRFAAAVFSNLTQDHLDYHGDMERYFDAKLRLFDGRTGAPPELAVVNADDEAGRRIEGVIAGRTPLIRYGMNNVAERAPLDFRVDHFETTPSGMRIRVTTAKAEAFHFQTSLTGRPHAYNVLAAAATALTLGVPLEHVATGIATVRVPGRFEIVSDPTHAFLVAVDYAHTPDALVNVTGTARALATARAGRVITLFGCGGDKDRSKRPLMAKAAAEGSDIVVMTSDNPRSEDPEKILDDAEAGLRGLATPYHRLADRREAIAFAIGLAQPNDVVVLAGKGHETYQILGDRTIHFDDRETARDILARIAPKESAHAR